jgi:hypothetical protein
MKRVTTFLQSTMSDQRLNDLCLSAWPSGLGHAPSCFTAHDFDGSRVQTLGTDTVNQAVHPSGVGKLVTMGRFTELVQCRNNRGRHRQELFAQNLDNDKRCLRWPYSKINSEHSERPESSSERVKIAWLGVRKLIPSARSVLRTNFRIRPMCSSVDICPNIHGKMEQIRPLETITIAKSVRRTKVNQIGRKYELVLRRIYAT